MTLQYYCAIFTRFNIIKWMVAEVGSALMFLLSGALPNNGCPEPHCPMTAKGLTLASGKLLAKDGK